MAVPPPWLPGIQSIPRPIPGLLSAFTFKSGWGTELSVRAEEWGHSQDTSGWGSVP